MDGRKDSEIQHAIKYLEAQLVEPTICIFQAQHNAMLQLAIGALKEKKARLLEAEAGPDERPACWPSFGLGE